ncbi:hypothetical protein ADUPG1_012052 [Aduncisulcus paluster]|uniref:Uncharacterized protein n=1 Tax=Aduncisulcus paluster TaxID=2918883 RepID=A0ABQ5JY30_9EUKA|nr:hypothetical protein ADUPG1_012052 [Aduncisulcus paluster]
MEDRTTSQQTIIDKAHFVAKSVDSKSGWIKISNIEPHSVKILFASFPGQNQEIFMSESDESNVLLIQTPSTNYSIAFLEDEFPLALASLKQFVTLLKFDDEKDESQSEKGMTVQETHKRIVAVAQSMSEGVMDIQKIATAERDAISSHQPFDDEEEDSLPQLKYITKKESGSEVQKHLEKSKLTQEKDEEFSDEIEKISPKDKEVEETQNQVPEIIFCQDIVTSISRENLKSLITRIMAEEGFEQLVSDVQKVIKSYRKK